MHKCEVQYEVRTEESRRGGGVSVETVTIRASVWSIEGGRVASSAYESFRSDPQKSLARQVTADSGFVQPSWSSCECWD